ncbi:MAG: ABC transporter ATP-binding protein [Geminicoccaceae bacterium]|nr:ABC transporter ATP-binding protein [Geminicoccaceae bacterium]MCB9942978.1 ABC transporter ATP-binding protein [Geminicoccaceae bacterium]
MTASLTLENVTSGYGRARILFDLTMEIARGEVAVLFGRNGAGKSTTMKTVMGLLPAWSGRIVFEGADIGRLPPHAVARRGIGYVPEDRRVFAELTVMENLEVGRRAAAGGSNPWTPERLFGIFPNLAEMRRRPGGQMSGGEQQMLTIARTLMGNPRLVLLDEPSEGLAPVIVDTMAAAIDDLKREGLSILLSEQNLRFARRVADRALLIEKGRILQQGTLDELDRSGALEDMLRVPA